MVRESVLGQLVELSTAHLADACLRAGNGPRVAPNRLIPIHPAMTIHGPAVPVRHYGSVDIFLEAIDSA